MERGVEEEGRVFAYGEAYSAVDDEDEDAVDIAVGEAKVEEEDGEADEGRVPEVEEVAEKEVLNSMPSLVVAVIR